MTSDSVSDYYGKFDEWGRLETPAGRLELERTLSLLECHLEPGSHILDLGGGPGRYAIALARRGHTVCLADLSRVQLDVARERIAEAGIGNRVTDVVELDARDLSSFSPESFDAAVVLGPFYHLIDADDRLRAVQELYRVLRPNGTAFIAFIPRSSGISGLIARAAQDPEQVPPETLERAVRDGIFINPTDHGFQDGYYPHPEEIAGLLLSEGFLEIDRCSLRGLCFGQEESYFEVCRKAPETARVIADTLELTARDAAIVAAGGHALLVVQRT